MWVGVAASGFLLSCWPGFLFVSLVLVALGLPPIQGYSSSDILSVCRVWNLVGMASLVANQGLLASGLQ